MGRPDQLGLRIPCEHLAAHVEGILLSVCVMAVAVGTGQLLLMLVSVGGGVRRYFAGRSDFNRKAAAR